MGLLKTAQLFSYFKSEKTRVMLSQPRRGFRIWWALMFPILHPLGPDPSPFLSLTVQKPDNTLLALNPTPSAIQYKSTFFSWYRDWIQPAWTNDSSANSWVSVKVLVGTFATGPVLAQVVFRTGLPEKKQNFFLVHNGWWTTRSMIIIFSCHICILS